MSECRSWRNPLSSGGGIRKLQMETRLKDTNWVNYVPYPFRWEKTIRLELGHLSGLVGILEIFDGVRHP
ncbi:MAG: hypothetical protein P8L18_09165 [Verrucomicrobiota bacterium]|nr:hypothetical protein [Verrucomicrobiota bacterium]